MNITEALKIEGWMTEKELTWLAEQASEHQTIVEIGSYLGRSTRALADNTPGRVYAVDHWYGPVEVEMAPWEREALFDLFIENMNGLLESKKVIPVRCNSKTVQIALKPDMVFIDGDHAFDSVRYDIEKWRDTDLLCGHDVSWEGVQQALNECFADGEIEVVEGTEIWRRV